MKRPIVFIVLYLCLGILTNCFFTNTASIILISIGLFVALIFLRYQYKLKSIYFLYVFFILGFIISFNSTKDINTLHDKTEITGYIVNKSDYISYDSVVINDIDTNTKIKVITNNTNYDISDEVAINGTFSKVQKGDGQYYYLKSNNIDYTSKFSDIKYVSTKKDFRYYSNFLSKKLEDVYDKTLPQKQASIAKALIINKKDTLSDETVELYRKGGIYHILALSGMHIGILAAFIMYTLGLFITSKKKNVFTILFLVLYLFFTGCSVSTTRAVIMASVVLLAPIFKRDYDFLSSIAFSALIILIIFPLSILSTGFILTYSAVLSLCLLVPKIQKRLDKIVSIKISTILSPLISIYITSSIILCYYFYYFYPYSIVVNLFISFLIAPLIILSFLMGFIGIFSIPIASILAPLIYYILLFIDIICALFLKLPFSQILVGKPNILLMLGYFFIIFLEFFSKFSKKTLFIFIIVLSLFTISLFDYEKISLLNNTTNAILVQNNSITIIDNKKTINSFLKNNILETGKDKANIIVTNSLDATIFLYENDMLNMCYISSNNPLIDTLKKLDIPYILVLENEKFSIDDIKYSILGENINVYTKNVHINAFLQDLPGYDIIVNDVIINENLEDINIYNNNYVYIYKDYVLIR